MPMQYETTADTYAEMTDSSRSSRLALHGSTEVRWDRVKPDLETNPQAAFDHKDDATDWREVYRYRAIRCSDAGRVVEEADPEPAADTHKAKTWYKVGSDSRTLGIGTKNDLRAQGKQRHDEPPPPNEIRESVGHRKDGTDEEQEKPEPTALEKNNPYFHFHQFKDEPQTMASELAAMLLEFYSDEQQTTSLLDLLKEQIKLKRKALAVPEGL